MLPYRRVSSRSHVYSTPDKEKKKQISANYSRHVWCRNNHAVRKHKSLEKKKKKHCRSMSRDSQQKNNLFFFFSSQIEQPVFHPATWEGPFLATCTVSKPLEFSSLSVDSVSNLMGGALLYIYTVSVFVRILAVIFLIYFI